MGTIASRLEEMGITLPTPAKPVANYVAYTVSGNLVFISGQVPYGPDGLEYQGKVGADLTTEDGVAAARLCAINILAQLRAALDGDLERVVRCLKLGGFVNAVPDFADHPAVVNGASNLMVEVLGDRGRHARFAVGAASLPLNVAVEVDAIFEVR
jgi:enamine deaminase RidA (YjgF/YER057c/UK114 family)